MKVKLAEVASLIKAVREVQQQPGGRKSSGARCVEEKSHRERERERERDVGNMRVCKG